MDWTRLHWMLKNLPEIGNCATPGINYIALSVFLISVSFVDVPYGTYYVGMAELTNNGQLHH